MSAGIVQQLHMTVVTDSCGLHQCILIEGVSSRSELRSVGLAQDNGSTL